MTHLLPLLAVTLTFKLPWPWRLKSRSNKTRMTNRHCIKFRSTAVKDHKTDLFSMQPWPLKVNWKGWHWKFLSSTKITWSFMVIQLQLGKKWSTLIRKSKISTFVSLPWPWPLDVVIKTNVVKKVVIPSTNVLSLGFRLLQVSAKIEFFDLSTGCRDLDLEARSLKL